MARPIKNTVDYFPHIIQNGKTLYILESKYGNDGYAFWFKLLELLGSSNGLVYDYNNPPDWQFLLAKTKVNEETAVDILKTLSEVGAIDSELYKNRVIWSENFVKNLEDVYKRRKQQIPSKPVISNDNHINTINNPVISNDNTQSKLKYIKVNKIKTKETITKDIIYSRFETLWLKYPNKDGKKDALRHFNASVKTEQDWADIQQALENYLQSKKVKEGYIKNGSTWFNNWRDWIDFKGVGKKSLFQRNAEALLGTVEPKKELPNGK